MEKICKLFLILFVVCFWAGLARAVGEEAKAIETTPTENSVAVEPADELALAQSLPNSKLVDPSHYTLGPDDIIDIIVLRHPEFSGTYPVNLEGKIQYKFVGDMDVTGLTKKELAQKIKEAISSFVINPEVDVTITEYRSKVIYVVGEVRSPGKYYMRSDSITVREAVVGAGLPTLSAAMRRCRLITPDDKGKAKIQPIDLYSMLYGGNLKQNMEMHSGDVLYVPATVMAKIMSVINPVVQPIATTAGGVRSTTTMTP